MQRGLIVLRSMDQSPKDVSETRSTTVETTFKVPQISDWERYRPLITELYTMRAYPLRVVKQILSHQHDFHASDRMYKQRIKSWNLNKNYKRHEMASLLRRHTKEELESRAQSGNDSSFMIDGKRLSLSSVKRHSRLLGAPERPADIPPSSPTGPQTGSVNTTTRNTTPDGRIAGTNSCDKGAVQLEVQSSVPLKGHVSRSSVETSPYTCSGSRESGGAAAVSNSSSADEADEENYATTKRRKLSASCLAPPPETKALACPFYKHDPRQYNPQNEDMDSAMRYRTCAGPGWESISRLRQHLFRAHLDTKLGRVQGSVVRTRTGPEDDARSSPDRVTTNPSCASETISEEKKNYLKQKMLPGLSKEESWTRIYKLLFPQDSRTPIPYYHPDYRSGTAATSKSSPSTQLDSLIQHLSKTLPHKLFTMWQGRRNPDFNPTPTDSPLSAAGDLDHGGQLSTQRQSIRSVASDTSSDAQVSASSEELKKLISETVTETYREWLTDHMEQGDESDPESEDENHDSVVWANGNVDPPASSNAMPHRHHLSSTNYTNLSAPQPSLYNQQLSSTTSSLGPPFHYPFFNSYDSSIFDTDSDMDPATAYDFSYLPMSPGLPFLDPSMIQPDFATTPPGVFAASPGDGDGDSAGGSGALGNSAAADALVGTGWGTWDSPSSLPAEVATSSGTTVLPQSNPES